MADELTEVAEVRRKVTAGDVFVGEHPALRCQQKEFSTEDLNRAVLSGRYMFRQIGKFGDWKYLFEAAKPDGTPYYVVIANDDPRAQWVTVAYFYPNKWVTNADGSHTPKQP